MNNTNTLSELEDAHQFQTEIFPSPGHDNGFRRTGSFSDYPPVPSHLGLSTAITTSILSESNHQLSDLLTLEPAIPPIEKSSSGDQTSQKTPRFTEEKEEESDFLPPVEVKIEGEEHPETPGLEEMIDLSSFTDGIYICEVREIFATYPCAIKNQRKARNASSRGHLVSKPLEGGFGCLELVLYGIRELA